MSFWESLSQPQATLLSSFVTGICALGAIWLGAKFFTNKIKGLEQAIRASQDAVNVHLNETEAAVKKTASEVMRAISDWSVAREEEKEIVSSISDQVVNIANTQADELLDREAEVPSDNEASIRESNDVEVRTRDDLRDAWAEIQAAIEAISRQDTIDGRTRAKYARQDRRSYNTLIDLLEDDRNISREAAAAARDAFALRNSFRRRVEEPTQTDWANMDRLRAIVLEDLPAD
ncbi:hypothetical protein JJJ17_03000 [Paracoccus caeni]|uniref:Uncharacterized protein n=1 Tax=Paracoccus caeni TaxID=657651 RepID=A0A934SI56_9RHOB|nr:hypothetical protein [Paracoccus caeni]MBK4214888.1 hypothetical protein [Paracoccus caeni]